MWRGYLTSWALIQSHLIQITMLKKKNERIEKDVAQVNESLKIEKDEDKGENIIKIDANKWVLHDFDLSFKYALLASNWQNMLEVTINQLTISQQLLS